VGALLGGTALWLSSQHQRREMRSLRRRISAVEYQDRLKQEREEQEARALECLRRHKRSEARVAELSHNQAEHERVEQQLKRDVQTLERRLVELRQQRNTMRTRQSRAEAFSVAQGQGDLEQGEIGQIFERWESRVAETEVASGCLVVAIDGFDEEFLDAEEAASLKLELAELKEEK
jgi:phage shock protein A